MSFVFKSIFGPHLYRIYKTDTTPGTAYTPNTLERWGDQVITSMGIMYKIGVWTSPFIALYLVRRGYWSLDGAVTIVQFATVVGVILVSAAILRGLGRSRNAQYRVFLDALQEAGTEGTELARRRQLVAAYDFDMSAWPIDYRAQGGLVSLPVDEQRALARRVPGLLEWVRALPCDLLSYLLVHTIGRRLMYPGTLGFIRHSLGPYLLDGRTKLVEVLGGQRHALLASDGNRIDTMFVDRRNNKSEPHGDKLVICCEGNAGFYEIGAMSVPLEAGYSVLGWNHPGFGASSGMPFPENEQNAMAVVMEFAQRRLGFRPEDTLIYAWSIGGFTATWAGMTHRNIAGMVLDATFDDVVPLAVARMPPSWGSLVRLTCRRYLDLNNGRQLLHYHGPVLLVRRTQDEVITTSELEIGTIRANDLLLLLLQRRYPHLVDDVTRPALTRWLAADSVEQARLRSEAGLDEDLCLSLLASYVSETSASFPVQIGADIEDSTRTQLALFLADKHLIDFEGSHCTPLPGSMFRQPWDLAQLANNGFVHVTKHQLPAT